MRRAKTCRPPHPYVRIWRSTKHDRAKRANFIIATGLVAGALLILAQLATVIAASPVLIFLPLDLQDEILRRAIIAIWATFLTWLAGSTVCLTALAIHHRRQRRGNR
jgi:uncharacterized membrane protein YhaH (DUF805 family)